MADGGSTDATRTIVGRMGAEGAPVRLVDNPGRTTPHGLNAGARNATGDIVIIFGAHAVPGPGFVTANVEALRRTGAAATGGPIETVGEGRRAGAIAAALSHPFGVGDARFRFSSEAGYVDTIAFAAYRRECFAVVGGFDPTREKAEDDYFNYAIRKAGGRLYLDPAIRSTYFGRSRFGPVARQYFAYGKAKGLTAVAEPGALRMRHLVPAVTVVAGALLALGCITPRGRVVFAGAAGLYGTLAVASAIRSGRRRGSVSLAPITALAFPVIHASYGLGTLVGVTRGMMALARGTRR